MSLTIDELMEQLSQERKTFKFKFLIGPWYRLKYFIRNIVRTPWKIRMYFQRANRGFSDRDAYNADHYLALVIAGTMQWIVDNGNGVSMSYADKDDPFATDIDEMVKRRDADYAKHIAVFKEYAKNGPAYDEEWQKEVGGVLDKDMKESLQWLSEHFTELWD